MYRRVERGGKDYFDENAFGFKKAACGRDYLRR